LQVRDQQDASVPSGDCGGDFSERKADPGLSLPPRRL